MTDFNTGGNNIGKSSCTTSQPSPAQASHSPSLYRSLALTPTPSSPHHNTTYLVPEPYGHPPYTLSLINTLLELSFLQTTASSLRSCPQSYTQAPSLPRSIIQTQEWGGKGSNGEIVEFVGRSPTVTPTLITALTCQSLYSQSPCHSRSHSHHIHCYTSHYICQAL